MSEENNPKVDQLVALYIRLRDEIKAAKEHHETVIAPKKNAMERIEGVLQELLDKTGQIRGACKTGTFYTTTRYTATVSDKTLFKGHVIETRAWDLPDWKCNVTAARDFEKETGTPIPGVTINAVAKIGVRRPGAKADED